ncbi:hypothetical protein H6503_06925 [Candidatus Woesearchaeota archaeon]|nr:hypothetical protein [Candidatus Woesearchaeota archaeon]
MNTNDFYSHAADILREFQKQYELSMRVAGIAGDITPEKVQMVFGKNATMTEIERDGTIVGRVQAPGIDIEYSLNRRKK